MAGNARFLGGTPLPAPDRARREELAGGQHPFAVVLSCVDSRVVPELLFQAEPGSIFVARVLGNALCEASIAAIDFAVGRFGVPLVFVLGHSQCAALRENDAAIEENVHRVVDGLAKRSRALRAALKENAVGIAGGVYDIRSGSVTRLL
jgi:carbonic anhydrase